MDKPSEAVTADGLMEILIADPNIWLDTYKDGDLIEPTQAIAAIEAYYDAKFERALGAGIGGFKGHDAVERRAKERWYGGEAQQTGEKQ